MNKKVLLLAFIVGVILAFILWLNGDRIKAQATQQRPAEAQYEYAKSLYEGGFLEFFVRFARDKVKECLPMYVERYQEAIREYGKVFRYPDDVEYCDKATSDIEDIVAELLEAGIYQASLNGEENYPPYDGRFIDPIIEGYRQSIQQYPGTNEAAIAEYMVHLIQSNGGYERYLKYKGLELPPPMTKRLQKIVEDYPQSPLIPIILLDIADCYGYPKAIEKYQGVIQAYPNTLYASIAQGNIGIVYADKGYWSKDETEAAFYYKKAIEEITKVITEMPNIKYWKSDTHSDAREIINNILCKVAFPEQYSNQPKVVFPATIQLQPDKWNIKWLKEHPGKGKINCYIGNIGTYTAEEIDASTTKLNATVPAENPHIINKHPGFTGNVLKVKFNKFEAIKTIQKPEVGKKYEVIVYGTLSDGRLFYGISDIEVIGGKKRSEWSQSGRSKFALYSKHPAEADCL